MDTSVGGVVKQPEFTNILQIFDKQLEELSRLDILITDKVRRLRDDYTPTVFEKAITNNNGQGVIFELQGRLNVLGDIKQNFEQTARVLEGFVG